MEGDSSQGNTRKIIILDLFIFYIYILTDLHTLLSSMLEQNNIIIEENKKLRKETQEIQKLLTTVAEQNKNINEENKKLKEENRKIITHFTEEFISLKNVVNKSFSELKRQNCSSSILPSLPLSTVEDVIRFNDEIRSNADMKSELVRYKIIYVYNPILFI